MNSNNILFNNFSLKIFSLFLAIGVWVMITGEARLSIEKFINIDVEFVNVLKNANIYASPDKVRIKVRGNANDIKLLTEKDFTVKIDLANVRDGVRNYYTRDFLKTEKNALIDSVHPTMIEVNVREIIKKLVPVKIRFTKVINKKKKFYRQERIGEIGYIYSLFPDKVTVEGYINEINAISFISLAEDVSLSDIIVKNDEMGDDIFVKKVQLIKPKEVLRIIGNMEVEVRVNYKKKIIDNKIEIK